MHKQTDRNKLITITLSYRRALIKIIQNSFSANPHQSMFLIFFVCVQNMIQIFIEHIGTFENFEFWLDPEHGADLS